MEGQSRPSVRSWIIWFIFLCAMAATLPILAKAVSGGSASGILATGRAVTVHSDSVYFSCTFSKDTATIGTFGKSIVVGPTEIFVDGTKVATIDVATKAVEIEAKNGAVAFKADGQPVPSTN